VAATRNEHHLIEDPFPTVGAFWSWCKYFACAAVGAAMSCTRQELTARLYHESITSVFVAATAVVLNGNFLPLTTLCHSNTTQFSDDDIATVFVTASVLWRYMWQQVYCDCFRSERQLRKLLEMQIHNLGIVMPVLFNLFAAAEPSANVCVAHGTQCNDPSVYCYKRIELSLRI